MNIQIKWEDIINNLKLILNIQLETQKIQILILRNNYINQNITYGINSFLMDKQLILEVGLFIFILTGLNG